MKKTVAAHIKSFYEEERYSDEEIRKKALREAVDLLNDELISAAHPALLYNGYTAASIQNYMKHILRGVKKGHLSISIAAAILGLSEKNIQEMIENSSKIAKYYTDANIPEEMERTLNMVNQYIFKFFKVKSILDRTYDLVKKGTLSVSDAAYICGLGVDEYEAYIETVHDVDLSAPVQSKK